MTTERIQVYAIGDKVMAYNYPPIPGKKDPPVSPAVITCVHGASIDPLIQIKWPSRREPHYIHSNQIAEVITKTSKRKTRSDNIKYVPMSMHGYLHFQDERDKAKRAKTDNTNNNSNDDEGYNHINIDDEDNHNNIDDEDNHNNIDKEDNHNNIDKEDNDKNNEEDNDKNDEEDNDKNDEEDNGIIMNKHIDDNNNKSNNLQYQDVINVFGFQLGFRKPDLTDFIFGLKLGFEKAPVNPSDSDYE